MIAFFFKPFTSAEPGSFGELLEVLGFLYVCLSILAPILWYAWRGIDDKNRLRRFLTLACVPLVWPVWLVVRSAQATASYLHLDCRREIQELRPKRKAAPVLKSPRELGLWD